MQMFWLDLETTGLNPALHNVIEIAIAQADLERPFDIGPVYSTALWMSASEVEGLDPFIRDMHTRNGLLAECLKPGALYVPQVEEHLLKMVPVETGREQRPVLAGSSVHFDASFLRVHMPRLYERFSHRHYDVSAVKLFCRSLGMPKLPRAEAHRAADDIRESVAHAKACRDWLLSRPRVRLMESS